MTARDEIYALAFGEGTRALDNQAGTLDQVRVRSAGVLTTSTIASAFLIGVVLDADASERVVWYWALLVLGAVLYGALLLVVVVIQLPRYRWKFHMSPAVIVEAYADGDPPATTGETQRALALFIDGNLRHNEANLGRMHTLLGWALVLLIAEIAVWAILVVTTA
jgi:hypothetical protein